MEETVTKEVLNEITKLYSSTNRPVSLWNIYENCKKSGISILSIRNSLKWLIKSGQVRWEGDGKLVPTNVKK